MGYLYLGITIVLELAGTTNCMKLSDGFSKLNYSLATLAAYGACFYFFGTRAKNGKTQHRLRHVGRARHSVGIAAFGVLFPRKTLCARDLRHSAHRDRHGDV